MTITIDTPADGTHTLEVRGADNAGNAQTAGLAEKRGTTEYRDDDTSARRLLELWMQRAWRRPVSGDELLSDAALR